MKRTVLALVCLTTALMATWSPWLEAADEGAASLKKWQPGKGWGWVWGPDDEVGSLNEMTDASRLAALRLVTTGRTYDLGVLYDRTSYRWPGHSPGEIMSFRSPEGVKRQADLPFIPGDGLRTAWHSCALFINDNVATQIDGLAHATEGDDDHWYNGFRERDWGGDWGPRKCDASTIPPIVARGVLFDIAGLRGVKHLPPHYKIEAAELDAALQQQKTEFRPGDIALIRTGALALWGETGGDQEELAEADTAGITLEAAQWLVEQKGAMMICSDTSGLEYHPAERESAAYAEKYKSFMPVHNYLLIRQGVHIGEFHNLQELARDGVYESCYICTTAKIKGSTAGFTLRPIAMK